MSTFIIAEIGINHNGDLETATKLIAGAHAAGADAVKFQKRTLDKVYTQEYLDSPRESPWGKTQREQKQGLEFGLDEYTTIDAYCRGLGIPWFASAWDLESVKFLKKFKLKYNKIASPMLVPTEFLYKVAAQRKYTFISTGMSTMKEIRCAVDTFCAARCRFELMHCNSTYPMKDEDANLRMIQTLCRKFDCHVGYSGHEVGLIVSVVAVALGASSLERHITLDRSMYGSDQASSVELSGFTKLVKYCRTVEPALGTGVKTLSDAEALVRSKLRGA